MSTTAASTAPSSIDCGDGQPKTPRSREACARPAASAEPNGCEVGVLGSAAVGKLDCVTVPVRASVEVGEHLAELCGYIAWRFERNNVTKRRSAASSAIRASSLPTVTPGAGVSMGSSATPRASATSAIWVCRYPLAMNVRVATSMRRSKRSEGIERAASLGGTDLASPLES